VVNVNVDAVHLRQAVVGLRVWSSILVRVSVLGGIGDLEYQAPLPLAYGHSPRHTLLISIFGLRRCSSRSGDVFLPPRAQPGCILRSIPPAPAIRRSNRHGLRLEAHLLIQVDELSTRICEGRPRIIGESRSSGTSCVSGLE